MAHLEINGNSILISKFSSVKEVKLNGESLEKVIFNSLPNSMKDYRDYVCDLKIQLNIYGTEDSSLEILKDYENEKNYEDLIQI